MYSRLGSEQFLHRDLENVFNKNDKDLCVKDFLRILRNSSLFTKAEQIFEKEKVGHLVAQRALAFLKIKYWSVKRLLERMQISHDLFGFFSNGISEKSLSRLKEIIISLLKCEGFDESKIVEIDGYARVISLKMPYQHNIDSLDALFSFPFIKERGSACKDFLELFLYNAGKVIAKLEDFESNVEKIDNGSHIENINIVNCTSKTMESEVRFLSDAISSKEDLVKEICRGLFMMEDDEFIGYAEDRMKYDKVPYAKASEYRNKKSTKSMSKFVDVLTALALSNQIPLHMIGLKNIFSSLHHKYIDDVQRAQLSKKIDKMRNENIEKSPNHSEH